LNILIISALDMWSMGEKKGAPSLYLTLKAYADKGHKVYFLTSHNGRQALDMGYKNINIRRFSVPVPARLLNIRKLSFVFKSAWWLFFQTIAHRKGDRIAREDKIDLFYGYEVFGVPVASRLARKYKKPLVSRFQGTVLAPWMEKPFWKLKWWHHIKAMKTPADLCIMTDDGTGGNEVLKALDVDMSRVKFWMNGVNRTGNLKDSDRETFRQGLGIPQNKKILICVNRLQTWKRVDRIIHAMANVTEKEKNVVLLIIGDGEERKNLENMTENLDLKDHVWFMGSIPCNYLDRYYAIADIFVQTNDLSNVSNPLLEAMRAGKCIVTVDTGDTARIIKNYETGICLNMQDIPKIPDKILELLANDGLRHTLGRNAGQFAENNFWTWEERMKEEVRTVETLRNTVIARSETTKQPHN